MFKFSFEWIKNICNDEALTIDSMLNILNLQGFEIKFIQNAENDIIITAEIKANRPDMLSHIGIAREICAFNNQKTPQINKNFQDSDFLILCKSDVPKINNENFPIKFEIDKNCCGRFSAIMIENTDNTGETPQFIQKKLKVLGINCINPIVDITNYLMLETGQPLHAYDVDKLSGNKIFVKTAGAAQKNVLTLARESVIVQNDDIIISDENKILCIAGIIGAESASIDKNSKTILLESANFNKINIRITSRKLKISTLSSFRFERGVNICSSLDCLINCANLTKNICNGQINNPIYDFYPKKNKEIVVNLRVARTNCILGTNVNAENIIKLLSKYDFVCKNIDENLLKITVPSYRLDVEKEVDLIEEVARSYGYDNITPVMPIVKVQYRKNQVWENIDKIREILTGLGFFETINYAFIPSDAMEILDIPKNHVLFSDLILQNPISNTYSLMRPTLVYSLLAVLANNYSWNNLNLALFEIGKIYCKDKKFDTNCGETDTFGFIFSGERLQKGFGLEKSLKYHFYDLLNYLKIIFNEFGENFETKKENYGFCESGTSYDLLVNNNRIGFFGKLDSKKLQKIPNVKLIKGDVFYCEINLTMINEKIKTLKFESKFPAIIRQYNLVYKKNVLTQKILDIMKNTSEFIQKITICDIYENSENLADETHSVLFEIKYCSVNVTLTTEQIESVEQKFLSKLEKTYNAKLKQQVF